MIDVTPEAIDFIRKTLAVRAPEPKGLRLGVRGSGCNGLEYVVEVTDVIRDKDNVLTFDGVNIIIDTKSMQYLSGTVVGYERSLVRRGLKLDNPNEQSTCGCGKSFTVQR